MRRENADTHSVDTHSVVITRLVRNGTLERVIQYSRQQ